MEPLFSLSGPEWTPSAAIGVITHLAISHGNIYVSGSTGKVVRLGIGTGEYEELELPLAYRASHVQALYADAHSPWALIATFLPAETVYFSPRWKSMLEIDAPLPGDFRKLLDQLESAERGVTDRLQASR